MRTTALISILAIMSAATGHAAITGNPLTDGWTAGGNSLSNGVYVRGKANYAFNTYSASLTVGSTMQSVSGWTDGDTVIGVGGVFAAIGASDAGWGNFTGLGLNSLLSNSTGPKIQAKFGTDAFVALPWSASSIAPDAGNGIGSLANGGTGSVQVRSSGYLSVTDWVNNAGTLNNLASSSHINRQDTSAPSASVARLIWNVDGNNELSSWQILLNVTLLNSLQPWSNAPAPGSMAIMTVQDGDNRYTDALVAIPAASNVVPEPGSLLVWSLLGLTLGGATWWRRRKNAA